MRAPAPDRGSGSWLSAILSDRFRTYSPSGLGWSVLASAAAHAVLLGFALTYWGRLFVSYPASESSTEWILLSPQPELSATDGFVSAAPDASGIEDVRDGPAGSDAETSQSGHSQGSGISVESGASEDIRRLLSTSMLTPAITNTELQGETGPRDANSAILSSPAGDLITAELAGLAG